MADFASTPPSKQRAELTGFFEGGLPVQSYDSKVTLVILDVRNLRLTASQGKKLEQGLREDVVKRLTSMKIDVSNRSVVDMASCVRGLAFE